MKHVPAETLAEHAAGQLDLPMRVLVEAHLDLCEVCRDEQGALLTPGARLLAAAREETPPTALWSRLESALDDASSNDDARLAEIPLPLAARRELPPVAGFRWWRLFLAGARMAELATDPASGAKLLVGQMPAGLRFPRHEHLGTEHVVVLAGGYDDETGEYVAGDYGVYERGSEHGPETLDGDSCWILFRLEGTVRFRGWRGWLQRLLP